MEGICLPFLRREISSKQTKMYHSYFLSLEQQQLENGLLVCLFFVRECVTKAISKQEKSGKMIQMTLLEL